jgi:hypothetical protein
MADTLFVKSATGDNRVALHEIDIQHPGGQAFVAGDEVDEVAKTASVMEAIHNRKIIEASDADVKAYEKRRQAAHQAQVAVLGDRQAQAMEDQSLMLAEAQAATAQAALQARQAELKALEADAKNVERSKDEQGKTAIGNAITEKQAEIRDAETEVAMRQGVADDTRKRFARK